MKRPPLFVREFRDTVIGYDNAVQAPTDQLAYLSHNARRPRRELTDLGCVNYEPCILLGGADRIGYANFGHWCFEYLTRLAVIDRFRDETVGLPIAVWDTVPRRFWEWIPEITGREIIIAAPGTFCRATIPSCPIGDDDGELFCWPDSVHWLRQRLPRSHGTRRIYVARSGDKRRIINADEVSDALTSRGFETIDFAAHSFLEQTRIASEASIIVMPNGADAPITMFCEGDCALIELNNSYLIGTYGIQLWARINGNAYARLTPVGHGEFRGIDTDFVVNTAALLQAVDGADQIRVAA